jgi:hypothetical protein
MAQPSELLSRSKPKRDRATATGCIQRPNAEHETLYVPVLSDQRPLFDALITDYRIVITDYWLNAVSTADALPDVY